jgi:hypothetical protein
MAERNSSTSDTTRGSERGRTASGAARTDTQQNKSSGGVSGTTVAGSTGSSWQSSPSGASGTRGQDVSGEQSRGLVGKVREQTNARLSSQKDRALDSVGGVTNAVRQTTQTLRDQRHDTVARYIEQAADQIDRVTQNLKNKDVGELVEDAQRLARRQPALFVGSAFAIGLLGARFFKSSSQYRGDEYGYGRYMDAEGRGRYGAAGYGRALPSTGSSEAAATRGTSSSPNYPASER